MPLTRTPSAKKAKSVFFRSENDIDIYIEDTEKGSQKLYAILFGRVLSGSYRVSRVYPVGSRLAVIAKHQEDNQSSRRPRVYVIDGDMYLYSSNRVQVKAGLFVLPVYCVENILINEAAAVEFLYEEDANKSREQIAQELDFENWHSLTEALLSELFLTYGVSFNLIPDFPTVSHSIYHLISANDGTVDPSKINSRIQSVRNEMISRGATDQWIDAEMKRLRDEIKNLSACFLDYISGKDCLLPLFGIRMKSISNYKADKPGLKRRLALRCELTKLEMVKSVILG